MHCENIRGLKDSRGESDYLQRENFAVARSLMNFRGVPLSADFPA